MILSWFPNKSTDLIMMLCISQFPLLVPLQAGGKFSQGLEEMRSRSSGLLALAPSFPAQLCLLNITVLNLLEQL